MDPTRQPQAPPPAAVPCESEQQLRAQQQLRRTWLALSEPADPAFALPALRAVYAELLVAPLPPELASAFDLIERDVARTFGGSGAFDSPASRDALRRLLAAYALMDPAVGYVQSMNFLAGFALTAMSSGGGGGAGTHDEADVFALFVRLMRGPGYDMRRFFTPNMEGVPVFSHIITGTLRRHLPAVAAHMEAVGADPVFLMEWYLTLFTYVLPPHQCAEVWTLFFADGWSAVLRVLVVLLQEAAPHMLGAAGGGTGPPADFTTTISALKGFQHDRIRSDFPGVAAAPSHAAGAAAPVAGGAARAPSPSSAALLRWLPTSSAAEGGRALVLERVRSLAGPQAASQAAAVIDTVTSRVGGAAAAAGEWLERLLQPAPQPAPRPRSAAPRVPVGALGAAAGAHAGTGGGGSGGGGGGEGAAADAGEEAVLAVRRFSSADVLPHYFEGPASASDGNGGGGGGDSGGGGGPADDGAASAASGDVRAAAAAASTGSGGDAAAPVSAAAQPHAGGDGGSARDAVFVLRPPADLVERARRIPVTRAEVEALEAEALRLAADERRRTRAEEIRLESLAM